jgi:hypothetical protein
MKHLTDLALCTARNFASQWLSAFLLSGRCSMACVHYMAAALHTTKSLLSPGNSCELPPLPARPEL